MDRPNILIFMADQMLGDVVRPGHPCLMPNARRLAERGVRFEQTYCTAPHCCPSRASFFTGEYPSKHGVWNNVSNRCAISRDMTPGVGTFAENLRAAGYRLGYSGKWHVSDLSNPADFGWEEFGPQRGKGAWQASRIARYEQQISKPPVAAPDHSGLLRRPGWGDVLFYGVQEHEHALPIIADGLHGLRTLAGGAAPWCMFISVNPPHDCYTVPGRYLDLYKDIEFPLPASFSDDLADKPRIYQRMRRQCWDQFSEAETRDCLRHYYARCTMVDDWLGQLLAALEETGQGDRTLVLFTSDHGDYAGAHGLWCKGVPAFREAYAIPAVMAWPAGIASPGRAVEDLVSITDFMPTFVELAAGRAPAVSGRSLLPFLRGETPPAWRQALFTQMNGVELFYTQRAVWTRRWKYVYNGFDFDELYDRERDPHEMVNLAFPDRYDQSVRQRNGEGEYVPWPRLTPELEAVRKELYRQLWSFAREQQDHFIYTPYVTTAQASYGPLLGIPPNPPSSAPGDRS